MDGKKLFFRNKQLLSRLSGRRKLAVIIVLLLIAAVAADPAMLTESESPSADATVSNDDPYSEFDNILAEIETDNAPEQMSASSDTAAAPVSSATHNTTPELTLPNSAYSTDTVPIQGVSHHSEPAPENPSAASPLNRHPAAVQSSHSSTLTEIPAAQPTASIRLTGTIDPIQ